MENTKHIRASLGITTFRGSASHGVTIGLTVSELLIAALLATLNHLFQKINCTFLKLLQSLCILPPSAQMKLQTDSIRFSLLQPVSIISTNARIILNARCSIFSRALTCHKNYLIVMCHDACRSSPDPKIHIARCQVFAAAPDSHRRMATSTVE